MSRIATVPLVHLSASLTKHDYPRVSAVSQRQFSVSESSALLTHPAKASERSTLWSSSTVLKKIGKETIGVPLPPADQRKEDVYLEPYKGIVYELKDNQQIVGWGVDYLKALDVHDKTRGEKACIFILDTAGEFDHPDLIENTLHEYAKNFSSSSSMKDVHGHGTHCAGISAASDNTFGVVGVAPGAKLVPVKVLSDSGSGSYEGIANAIRYVADLEDFPYKKIISMSLGGPRGAPVLEEAIQYAKSKGVFFTAAAGNSGYNGRDTVNYPGAYPEVITVASIGPGEKVSRFSSGGPAVDFAAPGEKILSTHLNGGYVYMDGTSMSTPHEAGMVALIVSAHEFITTQEQLEDFMAERAKDIYTEGKDVRTGHGVTIATAYIEVNDTSGKRPDAA